MANIIAVRLENFQSHLDTYIEFSEGLNVIVGQSDSGKTAILRGIRWVLYNQPRGTDFIRIGADFVRVTVKFDHSLTIIRERTSSKNRYIIRNGEDELILEGFGVHVPKEVLEAHGMSHLRIDQDTELAIHLSQQLDGPFLLEQTNVARAKTLGRISGAHYLDMAIRDTTKDLSQLNQRVRQEEVEIERLQEKLERYEQLDQMKKQLDLSEQKLTVLKANDEKLERLKQIKEKREILTVEEKAANQKKALVEHVDKWAVLVEQLQQMNVRSLLYQKRKADYDETNRMIDSCQEWLQKTEHIHSASQSFERMKEQLERYKRLKEIDAAWDQLEQSAASEKKRLNETSFVKEIRVTELDQIGKKQERYKQLLIGKHKITAFTVEKRQVEERLQQLPHIDETVARLETIEALQHKLQLLKDYRARISELERRVSEGKRYIKQKEAEQESAEKKYEERLLIEGTCPTCGQTICKHEGAGVR